MKSLQELRDRVNKGIYADIDNLYSMTDICRSLAFDTETPAIFFIIERILRLIAQDWDDNPTDADEAANLQKNITEPLINLLDALENGGSDSEQLLLANKLVSTFLSCTKP